MTGIDHLGLSVPEAKLEEEVKFLEAALAPLSVKELYRPVPLVVGLGDSTQNPFLWVSALDSEQKPIADGDPAGGQPTARCHVAIKAKDIDTVKKFHEAALAAGGKDNGKPGRRAHYHPGYYGAFVIDPVGNNIEVVLHSCPEEVKDE